MNTETYFIYHIPGIKIGCTKQVEIRVKEQGYTQYELLETHTDIVKASEREIELQKEYGYKVDNIPYYITLKAPNLNGCIKGGKTQGRINAENGHSANQFRKIASIGGKAAHQKHKQLYSEMGKELGKKVSQIKVECPHCGKVGQRAAMGNWHFDKCKLKNN